MTYAITADDIVPYAKMYATEGGQFGATSFPTKTQVEQFVTDVSALINVVLSQLNLSPVSDDDLEQALVAFIKDQVGELVKMVNGAGRFGPTGRQTENFVNMQSAYGLIINDAKKFLKDYADMTGVGPGMSVAKIIMF